MADTIKKSVIWRRRVKVGLSRERVAPLLDPPVTTKTLERWEKGLSPLPDWRRVQLEDVYASYGRQESRGRVA